MKLFAVPERGAAGNEVRDVGDVNPEPVAAVGESDSKPNLTNLEKT